MKLLIIYPEYKEAITGGQIYDFHVIDRIVENPEYQVDFLTDNMLCSNRKYLYNFAYLFKFLQIRKYDMVLTNSRLYTKLILLQLFLKLFTKTKFISVHHHFDFMAASGIKYFLRKKLELSFLRLSYATIIVSPYVKYVFQRILPCRKFFYIELGIKKPLLERNKTNNHHNSLLYVGTIEARKGLIYLIEALDILSKKENDFHCNIVGKVVEEDYYDSLIEKINACALQDKITFCGRVDEHRLCELYGQASCFVFPSLLEGYGMVLLEAMSYGLPVVAFNNSAMPYTVRHGKNGLLAENKNAESFYQNISSIITDNSLRQSLSKNAFKTFQNARNFDDISREVDLLCQSKFNSTE